MTSIIPTPAELLELAKLDGPRGVSFKVEDLQLPLLQITQSNSPVCDKRGENYIPGIEPGDFWDRNGANPIIKGETGFIAILLGSVRVFMEWQPQRGGLVDRHLRQPDDAEFRMIQQDGRDKRSLVRRSTGNIVEDTRELHVMKDGELRIIPCTSTKITVVRKWMTHCRSLRHPETGVVLPSYIRRYRLTTAPASNPLGRWFNLAFADEGPVSIEEFKVARLLAEDVEREAQAALSDTQGSNVRVLTRPPAA